MKLPQGSSLLLTVLGMDAGGDGAGAGGNGSGTKVEIDEPLHRTGGLEKDKTIREWRGRMSVVLVTTNSSNLPYSSSALELAVPYAA